MPSCLIRAAAVGCLPLALLALASAEGTASRKDWRILFVRGRPTPPDVDAEVDDIWIADGEGSNQRVLIRDGERPTWSRDHKRIAFFRGANLWLANADGTGEQQLTTRWKPREGGLANWETPGISWGPIPGRIAFSRPEGCDLPETPRSDARHFEGSGVFEVILGSSPPALRELVTGTGESICPAWSPSGEHLAWSEHGDIWLARRNPEIPPGSDNDRYPYAWSITRLAAVAHYDYATDHASLWGYGTTHLSWSPDGRMLAYGMLRYGGSGINTIRLLRLKRTEEEWSFINLEVVSDTLVTEEGCDPCFTPDGARLLYAYQGIRITTLDGKYSHVLIEDGEQPCV